MFFGLDHAPQCRVDDKKGLPGVLRRHIVGARNVFLEQEDIFAKGLGLSVHFFGIIFANFMMAAMPFQ